MKKHYRHEDDCLNCGATLQGKFCYVCGQENLEVKENFGHLMNHAVSDYFHFDEQFFNTLKPLLFKPGKLTNEYMAGKRASYLHPVKMYIFISLIYFVLLFKDNSNDKQAEAKPITKEQLAKIDKTITSNSALSETQKKRALIKVNKPVIVLKNGKKDTVYRDVKEIIIPLTDDTTYEQYAADVKKTPAEKRDGLLKQYYNKKAFDWNKNPAGSKTAIVESMEHNAPKMMFLLLPLFAVILRFAFYRNKKFYVEHLIFSFHLHCFLFLLLAMVMLIEMLIPLNWDLLNFGVFLAIVWYFYKSLKVVYNRSAGRTISKMIGISFSYLFVLVICSSIFVIATAVFELG